MLESVDIIIHEANDTGYTTRYIEGQSLRIEKASDEVVATYEVIREGGTDYIEV